MQDHHLEQDRRLTPELNRLSQETGLPLVATNDSHYLRKEDARAHEILLCIQTGKTMSDPNRMRWATPDFYLKSRDEMMELFGELEDALDRTWEIAAALPREARKGEGAVPASSTFRKSTRPIPTSNTSRGRDSRSGGRAWKRCAPRAR